MKIEIDIDREYIRKTLEEASIGEPQITEFDIDYIEKKMLDWQADLLKRFYQTVDEFIADADAEIPPLPSFLKWAVQSSEDD